MSNPNLAAEESIPNGPGAAAILSAGIGSAVLGVLALAGDAATVTTALRAGQRASLNLRLAGALRLPAASTALAVSG